MSPDFTREAVLRRLAAGLTVQQVPATTPGGTTTPLAALTTRETSDPAIALLDAWAGVVDILSFSLDRIAAEGYLATAEEDRSVVEFARTVGYEPRPGLAATTPLAVTVLTQPGLPGDVPIPAGLPVQTIPGQDQQPQVFQTVESITGKPEWNTFTSGPVPADPLSPDAVELTASTPTGLRSADPVLVVGADPACRYLPRVARVVADPGVAERVVFQTTLHAAATALPSLTGSPPPAGDPAVLPAPQAFPLPGRALIFGHDAPPVPAEQRTRAGGLHRFNPQTQAWTSVQAGLPAGVVDAVTSVPGGTALLPAAGPGPGRALLVAAVAAAGLRRSTDLGLTWQQTADPLVGSRVRALCADQQGNLYAGGNDGAVLRSRDGGDSWQQLTQGALTERRVFLRQRADTSGTQPGDYDPATLAAQVATIGGALPRAVVHALAAGPGVLFAGTDDGVFRSTDQGLTWQQLSLPLQGGVRSLAVTTAELLIVTTRPDVLYHLTLTAADTTNTLVEHRNEPRPGVRQVAAALADHPGAEVIATDSALYQSGNAIGAVPGGGVTALAGTDFGLFLVAVTPGDYLDEDWPALAAAPGQDWVDLDRLVADVDTGTWLVLRDHDRYGAWPVLAAAVVTPDDVATSKPSPTGVSRVQLGAGPPLADFLGPAARTTEVLLSGPPLALTGAAVAGDRILLDRACPPLPVGRRLVITGRRPNPAAPGASPAAGGAGVPPAGTAVGEQALVAGMADDRTVLLQSPLLERYDPASLQVFANVVMASHGESVTGEVLGSGDATTANQRCTLTRFPLTALPADSDTGDRDALTVLVDGVPWREVPTLLDSGPLDRVYLVRRDDQGRAEVVFGDGSHGARPGTGLDNVTADYRVGLGVAGNVPAAAAVLLQNRPLGVQEITNPLAATGGADAETAAQARGLLGQRVMALGRLVTSFDVEHFARAFAGIANAQASVLSAGGAGLLHLTVAGADGAPVPAGSALHTSLITAIDARRGFGQPVRVDSYQPLLFTVAAHLLIDGSRPASAICDDARSALRRAFAVGRPGFGVPLHRGQVVALLQAVPGVIALDVDGFALQDAAGADGRPPVEAVLPSSRARWAAGTVSPAQLLLPGAVLLSTTTAG